MPFRRELAALVARSPSGQAAAWPLVETVQVDGICREVIAPAPGLDADLAASATDVALTVAGELDVVGVLAVEMFETHDGRVLVNELAMRPHNSGHWTIDGAVTSQFEQHLRAVLDLPLGDPRARAPWSVMVNVLGGAYEDLYRSYLHVMARDPGVKVHLYGKEVRPGRKVGHVTVCGADLDELPRARPARGGIHHRRRRRVGARSGGCALGIKPSTAHRARGRVRSRVGEGIEEGSWRATARAGRRSSASSWGPTRTGR